MSKGAIKEDLLPNWHVLDGAACSWRLVVVIDQETAILGLQRELWKSPIKGGPPRWCTLPESALFLDNPQTQALLGLMSLLRNKH